jgi:hypothetical protein
MKNNINVENQQEKTDVKHCTKSTRKDRCQTFHKRPMSNIAQNQQEKTDVKHSTKDRCQTFHKSIE